MKHYIRILLCFSILGLFLSLSYAQETSENGELSIVTNKAKESTVRLVGLPGGGTGFFVAPDKIATNFHVAAIMKIGPITAKLNHKDTIWFVEGVVGFDIKSDIAVLKIKGEGTSLPLADIDTLQVGEKVYLAGFPNLGEFKVVGGVLEDIRSGDKWLKTTVEAYPGNSGSPMLNSKGEIIGIHVGHDYDARPSSTIKALIEDSTSVEPLAEFRQRKTVRAYAYYMQGWQKYYIGGKVEEAIKDFNKAIELNPDDLKIYKIRGEAKSQLGDNKGARDDYNHVLKLNPDDLEIRKKLDDLKKTTIEVQSRKDGTVVTRTITRTVIKSETTSRDVSSYKEAAHKKSEKGDYAGAIKDYTEAIKLKPDDADTYIHRGWAKEKCNDYSGAIEDFTQAIKLNPNDASTFNARGWAKQNNSDYTGAIEDFTQAINLNLNDAYVFNNRAAVKEILGDYADAIDDYSEAIKLKPDDYYAYLRRGNTKRIVGDYAGAIEDYNLAIKHKSEYTYHIIISRGLAKHEFGDHAGAIDDFTEAIRLNPDIPIAYMNRGRVKADIENYTSAIEDYNHAIKITSDDPLQTCLAYIGRGNVQHKLGDYSSAIEDFNQAIKLKPDYAHAYNDRGNTKVALKDYDGAIADYDKAIELNPKFAKTYHNRGLAKEAFGQYEAAKADFEKAKKIEQELKK